MNKTIINKINNWYFKYKLNIEINLNLYYE